MVDSASLEPRDRSRTDGQARGAIDRAARRMNRAASASSSPKLRFALAGAARNPQAPRRDRARRNSTNAARRVGGPPSLAPRKRIALGEQMPRPVPNASRGRRWPLRTTAERSAARRATGPCGGPCQSAVLTSPASIAAELPQQRQCLRDPLGRRLLEPGKRGHVRLAPREQVQHGAGQIDSGDLGQFVLGQCPLRCFSPKPQANARRGSSRAAGPLIGRRPRDPRHVEPIDRRAPDRAG